MQTRCGVLFPMPFIPVFSYSSPLPCSDPADEHVDALVHLQVLQCGWLPL